MKKFALLSVLIVFGGLLRPAMAQLTLTAADFNFVPGDTLSYQWTVFPAAKGLPAHGAGQTYDYSDATNHPSANNYVNRAAAVPAVGATAFSTATYARPFAQTFGGIIAQTGYDFYKVDANGHVRLGRYFDPASTGFTPTDSILFPAQSGVLSGTGEVKQAFPMSLNSTWQTNARSVVSFTLKLPSFGLALGAGELAQNYADRDTVVGEGTLVLPSGSIPVLLVKHYTAVVDSYYVDGAPAPAALLNGFQLTQGAVSRDTLYYFYAAASKGEVALINYNASTNLITDFRYLTTAAVTSVSDDLNASIGFRMGPNPVNISQMLNISFDKSDAADWGLTLIDPLGRQTSLLPLSAPAGAASFSVNLASDLSSGIYFVSLTDASGSVRATQRLVVVR